jgi:replicative DNA helicase
VKHSGLPPHDIGAEEAVLAALLLDSEAIDAVRPLVSPEDFFREENRWTFRAALAVASRGEPVTAATVAHELDRSEALDLTGGERFLVDLASKYYTAVGVEAHARIVARDACYRRLIDVAGELARVAYQGGPDLEVTLARARAQVESVEPREQVSAVVTAGEAIAQELARTEAPRVTSGLPALDRILGGLAMGQLTVVGAGTDSGKTSLLVSMALGQAYAGIPVLFVPLEGTRAEVLAKCADHAYGTSLDYGSKVGWPAGQDEAGWWRAYQGIGHRPLYFLDDGRTPTDIDALVAAVAAGVRHHGVRVVYFDHIDALPHRRERGQSDASMYAGRMHDLQSAAIRHNVHIVVASQVNREARRDGGDVPAMHHLKESSAKEQAAQNVLMLGLAEVEAAFARELQVYVAKVKGYPRGRWVLNRVGLPALFLDVRAGAVYESNEPPAPPPPRERVEQSGLHLVADPATGEVLA